VFVGGPVGQHLLGIALFAASVLMSWRGFVMTTVEVFPDRVTSHQFFRNLTLSRQEIVRFFAQPRHGGGGQPGFTLAAEYRGKVARFPAHFSATSQSDASATRVGQVIVIAELNDWLERETKDEVGAE
jgi:hypothetical protein